MDQRRFDADPDPDRYRHQNRKSDPDPDRLQNDDEPQYWRLAYLVKVLAQKLPG